MASKVILATDIQKDQQAIYVDGELVATSEDISQAFFYASQLAEWCDGKAVQISEVDVDLYADGDGMNCWPSDAKDLEVHVVNNE